MGGAILSLTRDTNTQHTEVNLWPRLVGRRDRCEDGIPPASANEVLSDLRDALAAIASCLHPEPRGLSPTPYAYLLTTARHRLANFLARHDQDDLAATLRMAHLILRDLSALRWSQHRLIEAHHDAAEFRHYWWYVNVPRKHLLFDPQAPIEGLRELMRQHKGHRRQNSTWDATHWVEVMLCDWDIWTLDEAICLLRWALQRAIDAIVAQRGRSGRMAQGKHGGAARAAIQDRTEGGADHGER